MGDELNGNDKSRLDRIEELLHVLVNEHIDFHEEHRELLKAQVLLYDAQRKTDGEMALLAAAQRNADERMAALIITVDDLVRRPPQNS